MPRAKLIVNNEKEVAVEDGVIAVGRASDNTIPLDYDSNVSRYHVEIETRGDEFWLIELGSSNGTTVNGERVTDERELHDGDVILLGGSSELIFETEKEAKPEPASAAAAPSVSAAAAPAAPSISVPSGGGASLPAAEPGMTAPSKLPLMLGVMGVVCGLAVIAVIAAVVISFRGGGQCTAKAVISSPENGDTIKKETDIEVDLQPDDDCAAKAVFLMDGKEFASTGEKPFKGSFDPAEFPDTGDGTHSLQVALQNEKGEKIIQPGSVELSFETLVEATPTPTPTPVTTDKPTPKPTPGGTGKTASTIEIQGMIQSLLGEFKGLPAYKLDPQFLQEVQKRTGEYASDGYFARAQNYSEAIKVGYIQGAGLDAPLGYILAMSRTQFKLPPTGAEEGLWRINTQLATANGYNGGCGTETLSDPKQNCAAKASALYAKAMLINIFDSDLVYAVAAFGMAPGDAANWKNSLPPNRTDFWNVIKSPQRDEVVKFFAAGIVAENPQKFGLKKDQPISTLYRNYLGK